MKVLGISPLDKDSTVTLVEDGVILYAAGEERFTRVKLQDGFPWQALEDALERTGTDGRGDRSRRLPVPAVGRGDAAVRANLANEREFLDETRVGATSERDARGARRACPTRDAPIPGLRDPNERMEKGLAQDARLPRAGERRRRVAQRRQARLGAVGPRRRRRSTSKWHEELEVGLGELGLAAS